MCVPHLNVLVVVVFSLHLWVLRNFNSIFNVMVTNSNKKREKKTPKHFETNDDKENAAFLVAKPIVFFSTLENSFILYSPTAINSRNVLHLGRSSTSSTESRKKPFAMKRRITSENIQLIKLVFKNHCHDTDC